MSYKNLRHKIISCVMAGTIGVVGAFSLVPAPTANAGLLDAVLSVGMQFAALDQQISYLNGNGRNELFSSMQQQYGVNNDPELNNMLDQIMVNLNTGVAAVDPSINEKPYNYFINNDMSFNAFCTLGHNLSVNTGLFSLTQNEDEIAVVLAHEIGHGQKDHVSKGIRNGIIATLGASVLANATGGIGGLVLGTVVNNQLQAKAISKPQEWEADNLAFDYIVKTSYNPGACAALWQRVTEQMNGERRNDFAGEIFAPGDHPTGVQRRDNYSKKLTELSDNHVVATEGTITINGKNFLVCANDVGGATSAAERAYLAAGNLSRVYENTNPETVKKQIEAIKKKKMQEDEELAEKGEYRKREFSLNAMANKKDNMPKVRPLPQRAYAEDGALFIDGIYILNEIEGEPSAAELADIFNLIK